MRILIFGNSGSGKTTLARTLAAKHRLAHLDLDSIVWEPGQIAVQRSAEAIAASLRQFLAEHEAWIIEGCYGGAHRSRDHPLYRTDLPQPWLGRVLGE